MEKTIRRYWPVFVLPTLAAFIIGFVWPFIQGLYLSFCKFTTINKASWVGISNYIKVFQDAQFFTSLSFTAVFTVVATDVTTGQPVYHDCPVGGEEDLDWFRASASMPLAANIVEIGGLKLLDGGISDSIPLAYAETRYEKNVVVLTQPLGFVKERNKALPMVRKAYKAYPHLIEVMAHRHENYNRATAYTREQERQGKVFVIRPEAPLGVSRVEHDPEKIQRAYDHGRAVAEKRLAALEEFLKD